MTQVLSFSNEEKETVITYDRISDLYTIYTNVPKHITKCLKQYDGQDIRIITVHESGAPSSIEVHNVPNAITFRKPAKRVNNFAKSQDDDLEDDNEMEEEAS